MLSVLIPVFNYDCRELVKELFRQAEDLRVEYEILVADDCSSEEYRKGLREINQWPNCRFLELDHNVGRAVIRNTLARKANFRYLLFLDADARVSSSSFLENYLKLAEESSVIYGGLVYPDTVPPVGMRLRYYYGVKKEQLSLTQREKAPYQKFNSINFLVAKALFLSVLFDESFVTYGHEDTYFGLQLQLRGIPVRHIDNPVVHYNFDSDEEFLRKTRSSVRALYEKREMLEEVSGMLRLLKRLNSWHLVLVTAVIFRLFHQTLERKVTGVKPSIRWFSFYKLGYLCSCQVRDKQN